MAEYHARLSPSGAHCWMECHGAPAMQEGTPDNGSWYADEGTAAHTLATWCLEGKTPASIFLGDQIKVGERSFEVTKEMAGHVQAYVDFVQAEAKGGMLIVERDVPIGHLTGEEGATGRADAIAVFSREGRIKVIDFKYGAGEAVSAINNKQAKLYGLGVIEDCALLGDFSDVSLYIFQPRANNIGEYHLSVADLLSFGEEVKLAAARVAEATKTYKQPGIDKDAWEEEYLSPGEKQCRWCSVKHSCGAKVREVTEAITGLPATAEDFASMLVQPLTPQDGNNFLAIAMAKVGSIEDWCKSVRAELERRLFAGETFADYKLVEGKLGNREWADRKRAEETLKSMRLKQDEMYERKLINPTAAEKLLKKSNPVKWQKLQEHIHRAPGKPSVAPATDPRPALAITATAEDFSAFAQVAE